MKKLLLILLSTVITSLQAQNFNELSDNLSIENTIYLENKVDIAFTETLKITNNLFEYNLFRSKDSSYQDRSFFIKID